LPSDAKIIVGLSSFVFALLHLVVLGGAYISSPGELSGWIMFLLEFPLIALWPIPSEAFIYHAYLWIGGTAMYALFGALVGIGLYGLRLVVLKLNE
jgi:hypothetical protein